MRSLRVGDRVRGKEPYAPRELVGTVVEVSQPSCMTNDGGAVVTWDDPAYTESWYSYQSMVVLLPEDFGAGEKM